MMTQPQQDEYLEIKSIRFSFKDISAVVEKFYREVARDEVLKVPFGSVTDWPHHIENLTHFWWTRFGGRAYLHTSYDPVGKHFEAGFNQLFLERWLELFNEILEHTLTPEQARLWHAITVSMGNALSHNNELMKQHYAKKS